MVSQLDGLPAEKGHEFQLFFQRQAIHLAFRDRTRSSAILSFGCLSGGGSACFSYALYCSTYAVGGVEVGGFAGGVERGRGERPEAELG